MAKKEPRKVPDQMAAVSSTPPNGVDRIVALDALRGFDMFWIVGGRELLLAAIGLFWSQPPAKLENQLRHVDWAGFTAWDLIMPLFLFVVGAAMPFSLSRRLEQGASKAELHFKVIRRTLILFVLGMAVQGNLLDFDLSTLHIYCNTLQAIAAGYLVAGFLLLNFGVVVQIAVTALLLIGYWLLLRYVPFEGHPAGTIEPNANLALAVDKFVLRRFIDGTDPPYTWIVSSLTFAATVMLGVFAGHVLRTPSAAWKRLLVLTALGLACLAAGWSWAEWGGMPIIKHIWTSSMTLWAGGWSFLLLALFYLLIDILGWRRWAFPFVVIGMNAITIYVANRFVPFKDISKGLVGGLAGHLAAAGPLLVQFTAVLLAWLLLYHLYRQRIFLRI